MFGKAKTKDEKAISGRKGYRVSITTNENLARGGDKPIYIPKTEVICVLGSSVAEVLASLVFREDLDEMTGVDVREIGLIHDAEKVTFSGTVTTSNEP